LAEKVKSLGFEVGFNVMYMSKWINQKDFLALLPRVIGVADYFYLVDSYGGVFPKDVREIVGLVKDLTGSVSLGFHGHNNLELALINTLTAIEAGCEIVDATITGMGRGAGNLKTELLLTVLNSEGNLVVDFNSLSKIVDSFSNLQKKYDWGTNLPYMVSGAHSLPQKEVMDWVGKRYYSFNSIIRALQNRAKGIDDNITTDKLINQEKML
jgi:4-hydroxy 2-oxovalerate aldolase